MNIAVQIRMRHYLQRIWRHCLRTIFRACVTISPLCIRSTSAFLQ